MRSALKKIYALLFLLAFLTPAVGETLHQLSHASELHCNEKSEHHFHELQHHCDLCDYTFISFQNEIHSPEIKAGFVYIESTSTLSAETFFTTSQDVNYLRGPPQI
jgi:hypothetical protein